MTLAERLQDTPKRTTGKPCSVGAVEECLDGKEADAFHAMLHTLGWSGRAVWDAVHAEAKALRDAGDLERASVLAAMSQQQVNRHRSRSCSCWKAAA